MSLASGIQRAALVAIGLLPHPSVAAFYYPDPQTSLLEHILVDNWGAYASNFSSAITPCTRYVTELGDAALNSGRTSAAQWIRVGFHDFTTADVAAGTGGMDASIGWETFRSDNNGPAFNDSFLFWRPFVNEHVSMADMVAMGSVMSLNVCGGQRIPFRPGRIDATGPDSNEAVPAPEMGLDETLEIFSKAGFNTADAIGLTACGHTMGSVHHEGFPNVSPESAVTPNNTNGGVDFDTTRGAFDPKVVYEYIDNAGARGGPLVTSFNVTARSDLRLYEADNNETMKALYDQGDGFQNTCVDLLTRMVDTVPTGITLGKPLSPMTIKPINVTYDLDDGSNVSLSGRIRVLSSVGGPNATNVVMTLSNGFSTDLTPEAETGSSVFGGDPSGVPNQAQGATTYFPFSVAVADVGDAHNFTVSGDDIESQTFSIQSPDTFIVPSRTIISGTTVSVTVAHAIDGPAFVGGPVVRVAAPVAQLGTLGPKIVSQDVELSAVEKSAETGGFVLWQGTMDVQDLVTGGVSIKILGADDSALDTLLISAGDAGW